MVTVMLWLSGLSVFALLVSVAFFIKGIYGYINSPSIHDKLSEYTELPEAALKLFGMLSVVFLVLLAIAMGM